MTGYSGGYMTAEECREYRAELLERVELIGREILRLIQTGVPREDKRRVSLEYRRENAERRLWRFDEFFRTMSMAEYARRFDAGILRDRVTG